MFENCKTDPKLAQFFCAFWLFIYTKSPFWGP